MPRVPQSEVDDALEDNKQGSPYMLISDEDENWEKVLDADDFQNQVEIHDAYDEHVRCHNCGAWHDSPSSYCKDCAFMNCSDGYDDYID